MRRQEDTPCAECGKAVGYGSALKRFCGRPCKTRFTNREMVRGQELYRLHYVAQRPPMHRITDDAYLAGLARRARDAMTVWIAEDDAASRPGPDPWRL